MLLGRDLNLTADGTLSFAAGLIHPEPDVRRVRDAIPVLYDDITPSDRPLYFMYRGVCWEKDQALYQEHDIRYDITVILPGALGREYIKTVGHFHPLKPHSSETFPEYYEVLDGEAYYLLQKNNRSNEAEEVIAVEAKKGDKVYIPSGYGHITINPGDRPLVMANLIESNFKSVYEPFREKRGAAYYYLKCEDGQGDFHKNPRYQNSVALKLVAAPALAAPLAAIKNKGLYDAFLSDPEAFKILK